MRSITTTFFSVDDEIDDFITIIGPGLEFVENTERLLAELSGRIDRVIYAENKVLDATNQFYKGNLSYQLTPRLSFLTEADYIKDSRRDSDTEQTGLVLTNSGRRRVRFLTGGTYLLTTTTATSLSYLYDDIEYHDPEFVDSQKQSLNFSYNHKLDQFILNTAARLNLKYAQPEDINERTFRTRLGLHYAYHENLAFEATHQYTLVHNRLEDTTANRNLIYGEIRWQWPLLN